MARLSGTWYPQFGLGYFFYFDQKEPGILHAHTSCVFAHVPIGFGVCTGFDVQLQAYGLVTIASAGAAGPMQQCVTCDPIFYGATKNQQFNRWHTQFPHPAVYHDHWRVDF
jgi:hypothetical protein